MTKLLHVHLTNFNYYFLHIWLQMSHDYFLYINSLVFLFIFTLMHWQGCLLDLATCYINIISSTLMCVHYIMLSVLFTCIQFLILQYNNYYIMLMLYQFWLAKSTLLIPNVTMLMCHTVPTCTDIGIYHVGMMHFCTKICHCN